MQLILSLLQQMSVFFVIAYLFSKTPIFKPLVNISIQFPHKVVIYLVFSSFCIMGTYFGLEIHDAIANTRAVGAVLGGLLGGPLVGFFVGLTGGLHRYSLGGFTDLACAISTTIEGLFAGLVHFYLLNKHRKIDTLFTPYIAFLTTLVAEIAQMAVILIVAKPFSEAWSLVKLIAPPMILANSAGAALFMNIIRDQKTMYEKFSQAFSAKALKIAERTVGILATGFNEENSARIAQIIYEETGVGAVAITDCEKILAFIGHGDDHHLPGTPISSTMTFKAIQHNQVIFADGVEVPYRCSIQAQCGLGSVVVIPLQGDNEQVIGTIKLYEPKHKLFVNINRTLGEGIARLMSNQILSGLHEQQKRLLIQAELKLIQAQINPHFLFNALNTISAIIRKQPEEARELLLHLSRFFRKNLKRDCESATLEDEIDHVHSYLKIEHARFADRLTVKIDIPEQLNSIQVPTFTLQPIVENAIKHGIAHCLEAGEIIISGTRQDSLLVLSVEDNAGLYEDKPRSDGLGMGIVDKRIKARYGNRYGLEVQCQPNQWTLITITLPIEESGDD
ncbi:sensor histidine kinase [Zooshikella ganghwensis]|uniref:histidine kinase n=1 Tax=Zooshikella ganghwensis TaxID=202772 RepID=A0A4P9VR77_9GAMM|nr:sensor histidine kinase [Zooshikella ganghwensis]RDH45117.1 sensor histidine kinase [Zooshikella ganghwensis]